MRDDHELGEDDGPADCGLPNRLLTAFEIAECIGCHEGTVRRAYSRDLLTSQRFGVRGGRFHPADVLDWISAAHQPVCREPTADEPSGRQHTLDLEVITPHYRGVHAAGKSRSGFNLYFLARGGGGGRRGARSGGHMEEFL